MTPTVAPSGTEPPDSTGGTIQSGTYDLVAVTFFDQGTSCLIPLTIQDTMVINATSASAGTATELIRYVFDDAELDDVFPIAYEYSASNTVSTWDVVCPEPSLSSEQGYSVDGETLLLVVPSVIDECGDAAWTFERR